MDKGAVDSAGRVRTELVRRRVSTEHEPRLRKRLREQGIAFAPFFAIAGAAREAWTLQRGPYVFAIPGTGNREHLEANVAAGALRLTPEDLARLDAVVL